MAKSITEIIKKRIVPISFVSILGGLLWIYLPTFYNAPRSDWWESLYFFHTLYSSNEVSKWLDVLTTDCFGHVTFRPISHVILLIQHIMFGANFIYMHVINFSFYCLSLVLIYKFAKIFISSQRLILFYVAVFAFLFTHFDIVSWTAHSYFILSFCSFLLGFILYERFMRTGRRIILFSVVFLFLFGMLCYEAFVMWPFAIIILSYIKGPVNKKKNSKTNLRLAYILVIGVVYIFYLGIFFLVRSIPTYTDSWLQTSILISDMASISKVFRTVLAVNFNILYNGVFVNVFPALANPSWIDPVSSNICMGGFLTSHRPTLLIEGVFSVISVVTFVSIIIYLFRQKKYDILKIYIFFIFLLFSFLFVLFHFKYFSNKEYFYSFLQFRYQYVPNAFILLIAALFIDKFMKHKKKLKLILFSLTFVIAICHMCFTKNYIDLEVNQMASLNKILLNIKNGINSGRISKNGKLYIDDDIVNFLPRMSWNHCIGKLYMRKTYQWIFNKREMKYFSDTPEYACWTIDRESLGLMLLK